MSVPKEVVQAFDRDDAPDSGGEVLFADGTVVVGKEMPGALGPCRGTS